MSGWHDRGWGWGSRPAHPLGSCALPVLANLTLCPAMFRHCTSLTGAGLALRARRRHSSTSTAITPASVSSSPPLTSSRASFALSHALAAQALCVCSGLRSSSPALPAFQPEPLRPTLQRLARSPRQTRDRVFNSWVSDRSSSLGLKFEQCR